jgi:hypothetical protein
MLKHTLNRVYEISRDRPVLPILIGGIYAEVVTFVAGSLEAGGLPGSLEIPEVLK